MSNTYYRGDIDSLRAIAVLSVVAFHAFPNTFPGGFIGVDIFFVISGYLITSKINFGLENNIFRIYDFYQNRIIRIIPALVLMLLTLMLISYILLTKQEYKNIGEEVAAASIFISNLLSWRQIGYFDELAETKPLLHLWSLGVEEQFYIIFPFFFIQLQKYNRKNLLLLAIILLSLILSIILTFNEKQSTAFYLPISRFFEFLIGSFVALNHQKIESHLQKNSKLIIFIFLVCVIGFITLIFKINKNIYFPGFIATFPCLLAASIISIGNQKKVSFIRALLNNNILKLIGLISYPIYLWHAPVYSIIRLYGAESETRLLRILIIIPILTISYLTYRFIELPLKTKLLKKSVTSIISIILLFIVGLIGLCINIGNFNTFENKKRSESIYIGDIGHGEYNKYIAENFTDCTEKKSQITCRESINSNIDLNKIVIIGDSHSDALLVGLDDALKGRKIINLANYSHKPGKENLPLLSNPTYAEKFFQLKNDKSVQYIVLSSYWALRSGNLSADEFYNEIKETVDYFEASEKKVYIYYDNPVFSFSPNACSGRRILFGIDRRCDQTTKDSFPQSDLFKKLEIDELIKIIDSRVFFCKDESCNMSLENKIIYRDNDHLNIIGAKYVGARIAHYFSQ
jgi:peptidoglycan/LPS O-acetylase OafA/YrhL